MNKLLITTALVVGFASNTIAEVKLKVGGFLDVKGANVHQKKNFRYDNLNDSTGKKIANNNIATDAYINFNIDGVADSGLKYGGLVKLNANTSKAKKEMYTDVDKNNAVKRNIAEQVMAYLESEYGRVEIGNYAGVSDAMKVNAGTFASATGGINGDSQYYWNKSTATTKNINGNNVNIKTAEIFLQTPNLPTNELGTAGVNGVNAAKINYYTPEFSGFRFGATFIPYSKVYGTASSVTDVVKDKNGFKNVFETGLSYTGKIKNIGFKIAVVGEFGKNKDKTTNAEKKDLRAFEVGANVSYEDFTIGGSYGDWGKYNAKKSTVTQPNKTGRTSYWTAGVGYAHGPFTTSITHLQGKRGIEGTADKGEQNKLRNTVIGVDYKLAPGLLPYVEFSSFKMNDTKQIDKDNSNKGHIVMVGMKLNF